MDTIISNQAPSHPSIDFVAEGMWRIAAGEGAERVGDDGAGRALLRVGDR